MNEQPSLVPIMAIKIDVTLITLDFKTRTIVLPNAWLIDLRGIPEKYPRKLMTPLQHAAWSGRR